MQWCQSRVCATEMDVSYRRSDMSDASCQGALDAFRFGGGKPGARACRMSDSQAAQTSALVCAGREVMAPCSYCRIEVGSDEVVWSRRVASFWSLPKLA
ncbi:hypothetical protein CONLIGDRAFT_367761 [Coniochaeta ligniaria NRRL 30616]|uniref:Uncharacterized protein n=1 Tax=Coniochaeta ligniaria NRRL 30616 TaxID=1408157 RepID=A0A1J7IZ63_9PEZI|nr:hypothetical protein CONLIGDRAFT_367761 [Coniochaeta ligniaria NRRL 30616]